MSERVRDNKNRWRSKTVAFRVSPEEWEQINKLVLISGLQKQEYIINRVLQKDIVVQGSPRTYKMLRNQIAEIKEILSSVGSLTEEQFEILGQISVTINGLRGEEHGE